MSRAARTAFISAQSAMAGPSSAPLRPFLRPSTSTSPISQRRSIFGLSNLRLPEFLRPKEQPESSTSASASTSSTPTTVEASTPISGNLFDDLQAEAEAEERKGKVYTEHRYKTAQRKMSPRKLNDLSRQIAGLPIDEAILQMEFSEKRASGWIKSTLCLARDHAIDKGLRRGRLVVAETWVSKGPKHMRLDVKGRGRAGIKHHPTARLHVLLKEGQSVDEKRDRRWEKELNKVRSAGIVREDGVLRRKMVSGWAW